MHRSLQTVSVIIIFFITVIFAGENDIRELMNKLDLISTENRQTLVNRYSNEFSEFREHYTLRADIRILGIKIGKMNIGKVSISNRDSFSISYDLPFDKWDTRYLSYWQNDSLFIDEVVSANPEKFSYQMMNGNWQFSSYEARSPRKAKQLIYEEGLSTDALNLIEVIRLLYQQNFEEIHKVLFLAEVYPIRLKYIPSESTDYTIYQLKWNVSQGEERVRLHSVYLVGIKADGHFIPLGGILKVSFVGLVDVNLIGLIDLN